MIRRHPPNHRSTGPSCAPSQLHGSRRIATLPVSSKFASLLAHSSSFSDFFSFCFSTSDSNVPHPLAHTSRGARPRDAPHTHPHSTGEGQAHSRRTHPQDRTDTPHRRTPLTPRHPCPQRSTQTGKITNGACPDPLSVLCLTIERHSNRVLYRPERKPERQTRSPFHGVDRRWFWSDFSQPRPESGLFGSAISRKQQAQSR